MFHRIKGIWKDLTRSRLYENYVEASYLAKFVRKFVGISVYTLHSAPGGQIVSQFTYVGFVCFLFWCFFYFYCVYRVFSLDLTILRSLYNTKLQSYGDEVERFSTIIFFVYAMWKLPFEMNGHCYYAQLVVDIDKAIHNLGKPMNFAKRARSTFLIVLVQIAISLTRILSIWASLTNSNVSIPYEKVFQVVYTDALALIITAQYCLYLHLLKCRYQILNNVLDSIISSKSREIRVMVVTKSSEGEMNTLQLRHQDNCMREKIKNCGKLYSMLYNASEAANNKFGFAVTLTMLMCTIFIILYLFYLMEATAAGLFYDFNRYVDFLVYVFWQIGFAISIIILNVYFCEKTVSEAKITSFLTHKIINSDINILVRTEAAHLSLQIIHQLPSFTANGFCKIDYTFLFEASRTVTTFLVILLQFAADVR